METRPFCTKQTNLKSFSRLLPACALTHSQLLRAHTRATGTIQHGKNTRNKVTSKGLTCNFSSTSASFWRTAFSRACMLSSICEVVRTIAQYIAHEAHASYPSRQNWCKHRATTAVLTTAKTVAATAAGATLPAHRQQTTTKGTSPTANVDKEYDYDSTNCNCSHNW